MIATLAVVLLCTFIPNASAEGLSDLSNLISGLLSSSNCTLETFKATCNDCSFSSAGKIDEACQKSHENQGKGCIASNYPEAAQKYNKQECPAIDYCVYTLGLCVSSRCPGTDKQDCLSPYCKTCYSEGDRCVARASVDCQGTGGCGDEKCEEDKGENSETCCRDCDGCKTGLVCESNSCITPQEVESLLQEQQQGPPTTQPEVVPTTLPQGTGILWALCHGGLDLPLVTMSMALIIGVPILCRKKKV